MTTPNYTAEMVALLEQSAPLDFDKAQALGKELNRSVKSIIAKAKREALNISASPHPLAKNPHLLRRIL